ncbi:MAG: hypothetical protein Q4D79_05540 [Propionibacteriaceae bacterium]|nr:hypothetical protein [Propionibacteriaceae bacterium]
MENSVKLSKRIARWFGLTGEYQPAPGEMRPLWHNVPKRKYVAISVPVTVAAVALYFILTHEGVAAMPALIVTVESFALAMLVFERASIRITDE